ncbi:hypothetical protein PNOK_0733300 [Pyrrhoderma noxium]|uniref:RRM domain-containing protein n=1 Tax=Pyrrhoderma noxium TaxID=2282107 RepID=A0A286UCL1_9AGAM|nr:hypothetical protein PNOK_0733300 [Pyrrhoderma noxium]
MVSDYFVKVSNLSPETTEAKLHDFFTFCGKIESVDFKGSNDTSVVYFEKPSAVTTALMLNEGTLDGAKLSVKSDKEHADTDEDNSVPHPSGEPFVQSDKPRAGIAAEYLAKGYTLSDSILQRAIELDQQKGISKRFLDYFHNLDSTVGAKALGPDQTVSAKVHTTFTSAADRARTVDEQKGYSKTAHEYYSKAVTSPLGQKVKSFYMTTLKQVTDIHEEARRIADSQKTTQAPPTDSSAATSAPPSTA